MTNVSPAAVEQLNQFQNFFQFKRTELFNWSLALPYEIIAQFTGNQYGKTAGIAYQYVLRLFGWHPLPHRNILYFECKTLAKEIKANKEDESIKITHPWVAYKLRDGSLIKSFRQGLFVDPPFMPPGFQTHPLALRPENNICPVCGDKLQIHKRGTRIIRFAAAIKPEDSGESLEGASDEIKNSQYPALKKWLPKFLIEKDITARNPALKVRDPNGGRQFGDIFYKGQYIIFEFVGYHQEANDVAGVQRLSCWVDEHSPLEFFTEQFPRLIAEDGDIQMTLTPARGLNWEYDEIFEKAQLFLRSDTICKYLKSTDESRCEPVERTDSLSSIAVIQAASDDNPTIPVSVIERKLAQMPDPDGTERDTRRYGIFKQVSGRVFKDMNYRKHVISPKKYKINSEFISECVLARGYDFHPQNPHAIVWMAITKHDEAFIYQEWNPSPDKWVDDRICEEMAARSNNDRFVCNLIDSLAAENNTNTGRTTIEEMNRKFYDLRKKGKSQRTVWESWNSKGTVGTDEIKKRLSNSLKVGKPFNNEVVEDGRKLRVPTLWIFNTCPLVAQSLKQWRVESWANSRQLATKDRKETRTQKFSHFCTAIECIFKDKRFRAKRLIAPMTRQYQYFQGAR